MKNYAFIIVACMFSLMVQAQNSNTHLKFMGIELSGTISDFQTKLLAKGLKVSPQSKQQPNGMRVYDGTFSGEDAQIVVWYNPRSKEVYRAKAVINRYGKDLVEQLMRNMERKLDAKYGTENKHSEEVEDDYLQKFVQHSYVEENGSIDLFIVSTGYSSQTNFFLHVDYKDKENFTKNTKDEMDDL
jgi:hypothetical protein